MAKDLDVTLKMQAEENFDLFGSYRFKVDAKGRVALPSKFRKALSKDLVVSRELEDKCIYVFEPEGFNKWVKQLFEAGFGGYDAANPQHLLLLTKLKANADSVDVDSSGRITLKQELREGVGIDREVVLVGNSGRLEIWDAESYDKTFAEVDLSVFYKK